MNKGNKDRDIEASTSFLAAERGAGRSGSPIQDLIKCFCGACESFFKRKSIEYALKANGEELLRDDESRGILKKFLLFRQGNSHFKSPAQEIVECFELCEAILNGEKDLEENRSDLDDLCYTEYWEDELTNAIDNGTTDDFFHDLMRESAIRLENTADFPIFKDELKKKLKIK